MTDRVRGKVAIVSGAASGMGAADARLLAEEGASVVLGDINKEQLESLTAELAKEGFSVIAVSLDVSSYEDWLSAVQVAEQTYGPVSVLVNNAGIYQAPGVEETEQALWDKVISVNQTGVFYGMKAAIPSMRRAGGGSIVNIASIHGLVGTPMGTAYHASKGAVRSLTKQAAVQYGPENIRVNSLDPGIIETQILADLRTQNVDLDPMTHEIPLRRFGLAREIACGVVFLASDESSFITGTDLVVDGGMIATQ